MKKSLKNHTIFTALFLCLIMAASFVVAPFVNRRAYATDIEEFPDGDQPHLEFYDVLDDYNPRELWGYDRGEQLQNYFNSYFSNNDLTEEYILETNEDLAEEFFSFVSFDPDNTSYLIFNTESLEEQFATSYPNVCETFGNIYSEEINIYQLTESERTYLESAIGTDFEDIERDLCAIYSIRGNIDLMNTLVEEGEGYINSDYEFVSYGGIQRWRVWGFQLRWNRLQVNFDSDFAIVFGFLIIGVNIGLLSANAMEGLTNATRNSELVMNVIRQGCVILEDDLMYKALTFFTDDVISYLCQFLITALNYVPTSTLSTMSTIFSLFMPSVIDGVIVLINAMGHNKGVRVTACWVTTWWHRRGISIKSI